MPEKYSRGEYEKVMEPFFTRNKNFYRNFFHLVLMVALQNLVAYSVNMLDKAATARMLCPERLP